MLDFIYTGRMPTSNPVSDHSFSALLTAASYLQLPDLAALCRRRLKHNGRTPSSTSKTPSSTTSSTPNGHVTRPQRLSSTPFRVSNNHHSGSREAERNKCQRQEGRLREDLSEEEVIVSGSQCVSLSPSGGGGLSNGLEMGLGLGLDLSKKSPSGSTATEEVSPSSLPQGSPHSDFDDTPTPPTTANSNSGKEPSEPGEVQGQPPRTTTDPQQRAPRKRPRPRNEGFKVSEGRELPNGRRKKQGKAGGELTPRGDSVSPELDDGEGNGDRDGALENGLEQSEESGQSESEGGGRNGKGNNNYIYRQPQQGFEPALGDNLYVCIPCGKGFPSSEQLNAHVDTHTEDELYIKEEEEEEEEGVYPKDEDPDADPENLTSPLKVKEPDAGDSPPRHICTVCSKSYKDLASLRQHEKSHWLTRPHPCNICGKLFTQRGTMTRHMRSHLGLKPYACEECGMRFTRQYRLAEHMRVHSGEKPYECQLCSGKFTQQRNLLAHLKMHTSPP